MEPDTIIVKVIQDCQTNLVPFPVIRLWSVGSENLTIKKWDANPNNDYPPVLDQLTLLQDLPEGHLMFLPLTLPPVQKYR